MKSVPTLQGQVIQNRVRTVGINPNYWYPVGWSAQLKPGQILPVVVWQQAIAVYRDTQGQVHALADACPHKGVALHKGEVDGDHLVCPYHGWAFDPTGTCVHVPYLPPGQKLPCASARRYPTREQYGILWVFPGDPARADTCALPVVPEFGDRRYFLVPITVSFQAHFSICNENALDVFHGFLHRGLQGWFDPVLLDLAQTDREVRADYQVSYRGWVTRWLGLSQAGNPVTTRTISIHYQYPHYRSSLDGLSALYLMRLPVGPSLTRSFSLLFLPLALPSWVQRGLLGRLLARGIDYGLFRRFVAQDAAMVASEQQAYQANPQRRYVEINPAILALQRVIIGQYEQFMQQSKQFAPLPNGTTEGHHPVAESAV